jgi:hypothetical protein
MKALPMLRYFGRDKIVATALALLEKANRRGLRNIGSRKHADPGQFSQLLNFDTSVALSNDWPLPITAPWK